MNNLINFSLPESEQLQYDRGLHYGDGLFETIAVKAGIAELLDEHINRLKMSCKRLKLNNIHFNELKLEIERQAGDIDKAIIKVIITRGRGGRGYLIPDEINATCLILHYSWPNYSAENSTKGIAITKCDLVLGNQPLLAGIKHLNRLENVMAKMELIDTEFQEGILCDSEQNVIEATSCNVFVVINNKVLTPKLDRSGVAGIMREQIIKKTTENGDNITIQDIPYTLLLESDEIFLSNSIIGIWPVRKLNKRIYHSFPTAQKLRALLKIKI